MHQGPTLAESPSFNHGYSSSRSLAQIAARVVEEFKDDEQYDGVVLIETDKQQGLGESGGGDPGKEGVPERDHVVVQGGEEEEEEKEDEDYEDDVSEFEFSVLTRDGDPPLSADEIFYNGQIRPIFPLFSTDSIHGPSSRNDEEIKVEENASVSDPTATIRLPLKKLMMEEREGAAATASCSSSEADELESLPRGTYCVWTPPKNQEMMRKKSNSTGSSKRWKLRELLRRSSSDGKETVVFVAHKEGRDAKKAEKSAATATDRGRSVDGKAVGAGSRGKEAKGAEAHYLKSRARRESDRKKSYLPYRQDLVGVFANVSSLGKVIQPF